MQTAGGDRSAGSLTNTLWLASKEADSMIKTRTLQLTLVASAFVSPLGSTAEQGEALYAEHCATCHSVSLRGSAHGASLSGPAFTTKWAHQDAQVSLLISSQRPRPSSATLRAGSILPPRVAKFQRAAQGRAYLPGREASHSFDITATPVRLDAPILS